jgi:hypothetical protein
MGCNSTFNLVYSLAEEKEFSSPHAVSKVENLFQSTKICSGPSPVSEQTPIECPLLPASRIEQPFLPFTLPLLNFYITCGQKKQVLSFAHILSHG